MNSLQERIYETGRRVQALLDGNDAVLGSVNKSGMRAELDAVVTALGLSSTTQAAGRVNHRRDGKSAHLSLETFLMFHTVLI